ncbi:MAG: GNAT family N-acetyltransferase [Fusobacteria bacterium]|nr:GNAT family N-acetyltransferase [Fusobacteriota bacterium]
MIKIYKTKYCKEMFKLFYETVHTINSSHYSKKQLSVWAKDSIDFDNWDNKFKNSYTIIYEKNNIILGFSNVDNKGYIDMFYVHKNFQNIKIGKSLLLEIEKYAKDNKISILHTYSSITAKIFFERNGFILKNKNTVIRDNISLENYYMHKVLY